LLPSRRSGEEQEARVRSRLSEQGYEQPYGTSDAEIRQTLGISGKCADFVGYDLKRRRWLIAESKGGDIDSAYYQLKNTMQGLLLAEPEARGKTDLHIYTSPENYDVMQNKETGLGGNRLRNSYLGYFDEKRKWHYVEIEGARVRVVKEQPE
jgi:hypothetical protein